MRGGSPSTVLAKSSARSPPQNSIVSIVRVTTKTEFTRNAHSVTTKTCEGTRPRASGGAERGGLRLALLCVAQFVVVLDVTIVAIALPAIRRDLGFEPADLQWVLSAYTLTFGGGLLLAGRVADLYGAPAGVPERAAPLRRRVARLRAGADRRRADRGPRGAGGGCGAGGALGARAARRHRARGRGPLARAGDLDRGGRRRRRVRLGARRPDHQRRPAGSGCSRSTSRSGSPAPRWPAALLPDR